jgi:hypothetical protein
MTKRMRSGVYPHTWKSGPCPIRHRLYVACQKARAQAWHRGQQWEITEQQFIELWMKDDRYKSRGRAPQDLLMTRRNKQTAWTINNIQFMTRRDHLRGLYTNKSPRERIPEYAVR